MGIQEPNKPGFKQVPGWNEYLKELHAEAREYFLCWVSCDRPKQGPIFKDMTQSRAQFKAALRQCLKDESRAKCDSIAKQYVTRNTTDFWKEVNNLQNAKPVISNTIDGVSGQKDIAKLWQEHYAKLLNSSTNVDLKDKVLNKLFGDQIDDLELFSGEDIQTVVKN